MFYKKVLILALSLCTSCTSCSRWPQKVENVLKAAGDNRSELEDVLVRYREASQKDKLGAAYFLLETMRGKYTSTGESLEKYYAALESFYDRPDADMWTLYDFEDSLFAEISFSDLIKVQDVKTISSDYLTSRIDNAFSVKTSKWAKNLSFDDFCEYILPYRIGDEEMEIWWTDYRQTFGHALDSLYLDADVSLSDFCLSVNKLFKEPHRNYTHYPAGKPSPKPSSLTRIAGGTCEDYLGLFTYIGRTYGIPVATDWTPQWGNHSKGHSLCAIVQGDTTYHFSVGEPLFLAREKPFSFKLVKVYRKMASVQKKSLSATVGNKDLPANLRNPHLKDVTREYVNVADVKVDDLFGEGRSGYVFLACFDDKDWVAVAGAKRRGNAVTVKDMGFPSVFLPMYCEDGTLREAQYPVLVDGAGTVKSLIPDKAHTRSVTLKRKFMEVRAAEFAKKMQGGRFELSDNPQFLDPLSIAVPDSVGYNFQTLSVGGDRRYRYLRYLPKEGTTGDIAEMEAYSEGIRVSGTAIGDYNCTDGHNVPTNAFDGDVLTYSVCQKDQVSPWIGLDLGRQMPIEKICYLPRSDDNFIREGEEYELCYWDRGGWVSLGTKTGSRSSQALVFGNVPDDALLVLHDHTHGDEERIFTYANGQQVWW